MTLENIEIFTGGEGIKKGNARSADELITEHIPHQKNELFVSDFDGCLISSDFGKTCFDQKLQNGSYWQWSSDQFSELLLPTTPTEGNVRSYAELLQQAIINKTVSEKIRTQAKKLQNLHLKLIFLYEKLQTKPTVPLRKQFAENMLRFDEIVLSLEGYFSQFFGNQIFSRLRFLTGLAHTDAKQLAIDAINNDGLPINLDLLNIFREFKNNGANGHIITTNFKSFVRAAVGETILNDVFSENDVLATEMQGTRKNAKEPFMMNRSIKGEPVFGTKKALLARQATIPQTPPGQLVSFPKKLILAAGDSPIGDGPMLAEALRQGGVGIVPVATKKNIEKVATKFEQRICKCLAVPKLSEVQKERIWYLQTENFTNAKI